MHLIDYFHKIENIIQNFSPILLFDLQLTEYTPFAGIIQSKITFLDDSILYIREYLNFKLSIPKKTYSYHYQKSNNLIFRYDNAPHHPEVLLFPHHKHVGDSILASSPPDLEKVLYEIREIVINFI